MTYTHIAFLALANRRHFKICSVAEVRGHARECQEVESGETASENLEVFAIFGRLVRPIQCGLEHLVVVDRAWWGLVVAVWASAVGLGVRILGGDEFGEPHMQSVFLGGARRGKGFVFGQVREYQFLGIVFAQFI